jgi:hypothetical protein
MMTHIEDEGEWDKMNKLSLFNMEATRKWVVMYNDMCKKQWEGIQSFRRSNLAHVSSLQNYIINSLQSAQTHG